MKLGLLPSGPPPPPGGQQRQLSKFVQGEGKKERICGPKLREFLSFHATGVAVQSSSKQQSSSSETLVRLRWAKGICI